jgi:selenide,water dikinase
MQRFSDLPVMDGAVAADQLPRLEQAAQPHCGGCGAKVGGDLLHSVLQDLAADYPDHALGHSPGDDAVRWNPDSAVILQSVDALRSLVADPWLMGRIAANHALSDLYASGAEPRSALALVTLPFAAPDILARDLAQLLAGAMESLSEAGCPLLGGHSMQGPELQLGFAVTGVPMSAGSGLAKCALSVGDRLILTRALGTGAVFAAHMQLQADGREVRAALDSLLQSNAAAARQALAHGARAATDVTGFGLAGHLLEMLQEGQGAELELAAIPPLPGAREALAKGIRSTMHEANRRSYAARLDSAVDEADEALLFDPQTGGGLLIGIAPERAEALREALRAAGCEAALIGEVTASGRLGLR